jgi:hypothetical protein
MARLPLGLATTILLGVLGCASSPPPAPCSPTPPVAASTTATPAPGAPAAPAGPAAALTTSVESSPADDVDKLSSEDLARKMLELTGSANIGKQIFDNIAESMKKMPGLPPGFAQRLEANARPEDLTAIIVPIYARNYERETMIATIPFYQSKQGHLLVGKLPKVTQESADAGREWGRKLVTKTLADVGVTAPAKGP